MSNRRSHLTLLVVLAVLVTACSGGTPASTSAATATVAAQSPAASQDICASGPVTINLLRQTGEAPKDTIIADFKAVAPCVTVSVTDVPFAQYDQKMSVMVASDAPADLYVTSGPPTASWAARGALLALDPYISADLRADTLGSTISELSYDGKLYGVGLRQSAIVLYYNKDLTDKAGIQPPKTIDTAWTWDQALVAFQKCQQGPAAQPTVWGYGSEVIENFSPGVYSTLLYARSQGDPKAAAGSSSLKTFQAISPDGKSVTGYINSPEAIRGLQFFQDLALKYQVSPKVHTPNEFTSGKVCFAIDFPPLVAALRSQTKFQWGVTPLPYFVTPITHTGGLSLVVGSKTKYPAAAAAFAMFVASPAEHLKAAQADGSLPVLKSVAAKLPGYDTYPLNIFAQELDRWGQPRPVTPHFLEYNTIVTSALKDIYGGADPKQRMDQAAADLDKVLVKPVVP